MRLHPLLLLAALLTMPAAHAQDALAMSGEALYQRYCSACHGLKGLGDGPVSGSLTVEVPNLTLLSRRHGGTFPRELVERIIDGRHLYAAHGTRTMPVWGEELGNLGRGNPDAERAVRAMIDRLTQFVSTLQRPDR